MKSCNKQNILARQLEHIFMEQQSPVGQDLLIIDAPLSHSDTPHSVGLLWTSDQPDEETST